nr:hypothetical protein [Tanacetum cinerariifolium]
MSSASSAVTYTSVYTNSEPRRVFWGADEELSDEEDEHILPAEEQPLPPIVSPTAESPGYVAKSDPKKDLDEYEDDEIEDDDANDEDKDEEEEDEEEEEHLASANSAVVIPIDELVSPPEGTEPVIPPPSTDTATTGARITVRLQATISFPPEADVETSSHAYSITITTYLTITTLHKGAYEVGESSTTRLTEGRGIDYGFVSTLDAEARRRGIGEVGYGIRDTWVDPAEAVPEIAPITVGEVNTRVTELAELHEHDTHDLYAQLKDAQDSRTRISQQVAVDSQRVDLLMEDKITYQKTIHIVEDEAYAAREAWAHSIGLSQAVHSKLQTHQEQASGADGRDSLSDRTHETRDGRHAGRAASTARAAEESWTVRRDARVPNH